MSDSKEDQQGNAPESIEDEMIVQFENIDISNNAGPEDQGSSLEGSLSAKLENISISNSDGEKEKNILTQSKVRKLFRLLFLRHMLLERRNQEALTKSLPLHAEAFKIFKEQVKGPKDMDDTARVIYSRRMLNLMNSVKKTQSSKKMRSPEARMFRIKSQELRLRCERMKESLAYITRGGICQTVPAVKQADKHPLSKFSADVAITTPLTVQTTAMANAQPNTPFEMSPDTAKQEWRHFLSTTLRLADEQSDAVAKSVRSRILDLIHGNIEAEEFVADLQKEMNSAPQLHLVHFLNKILPLISKELIDEDEQSPRANEVIRPHPHFMSTLTQTHVTNPVKNGLHSFFSSEQHKCDSKATSEVEIISVTKLPKAKIEIMRQNMRRAEELFKRRGVPLQNQSVFPGVSQQQKLHDLLIKSRKIQAEFERLERQSKELSKRCSVPLQFSLSTNSDGNQLSNCVMDLNLPKQDEWNEDLNGSCKKSEENMQAFNQEEAALKREMNGDDPEPKSSVEKME